MQEEPKGADDVSTFAKSPSNEAPSCEKVKDTCCATWTVRDLNRVRVLNPLRTKSRDAHYWTVDFLEWKNQQRASRKDGH